MGLNVKAPPPPPPPQKNPADVVKAIEAASSRVSELATQISSRITLFENWLNSLPGRIEVECWTPIESSGKEVFGLLFKRALKKWALHFAYVSPEDDPNDGVRWIALADGSLETKTLALDHFPKLLETMAQSQQDTVKKLQVAHEKFDRFATVIGARVKPEEKEETDAPF